MEKNCKTYYSKPVFPACVIWKCVQRNCNSGFRGNGLFTNPTTTDQVTNVGDIVTGFFSYDSSAVSNAVSIPQLGANQVFYPDALRSFYVEANGIALASPLFNQSTGEPNSPYSNPGISIIDSLGSFSQDVVQVSVFDSSHIGWNVIAFRGLNASVLNSADLPGLFPIQWNFGGSGGSQSGVQAWSGSSSNTTASFIADVTSVSVSAVPIPSSVWLFGSGMVFLVGLKRRKK